MNCLEVNIERKDNLSCAVRRVCGLTVRIGLVCTAGLGEYGIIWASDGKLITLEGGYLIGA